MPKTRQGGRKIRLRRLNRLLHTSPLNPHLGVEFEYASDLEYLNHLIANPACKADEKTSIENLTSVREEHAHPCVYVPLSKEESLTAYRASRTQRYRLVSITQPIFPDFPSWEWIHSIRKDDPRRARYAQRRAEILHLHYGAATPEHWGTASHPLEID